MTPDTMFTIIRDWAIANTNQDSEAGDVVTVIEANQNAPRPARPYITILVTSTRQKEFSYIGAPDENGDAVIENDEFCMVSIQCFGTGSKTIMANLRQTLEKVSVKDYFRELLLPFIAVTDGVNDLTETVGTQFEERAGMDLEFRTVAVVTDNVGVVQSVEGTATFDEGGEIEYVETNYTIGV